MSAIKFYKVDDEYGNFSNFSKHPIHLKGVIWPTVEHYFQAGKFEDGITQEKIRSFVSPMKAANEGRNRRNKIRSDWDEIRNSIMYDGLLAKFKQHHMLKIELLGTKDAMIVEHTPHDDYWGDGGDGSGENNLGKLLTKVRSILQEATPNHDIVLPPWVSFPEIDQYDMFWRMGLGESYLNVWSRYYLSEENKKAYHDKFPPPQSWDGIYD